MAGLLNFFFFLIIINLSHYLRWSARIDNGSAGDSELGGHVECVRGSSQAHAPATGQTSISAGAVHSVISGDSGSGALAESDARLQSGQEDERGRRTGPSLLGRRKAPLPLVHVPLLPHGQHSRSRGRQTVRGRPGTVGRAPFRGSLGARTDVHSPSARKAAQVHHGPADEQSSAIVHQPSVGCLQKLRQLHCGAPFRTASVATQLGMTLVES